MANIIRMKDVTKKVSLSRSTIYQKIKSGEFPLPFPIGTANSRSRGWLEATIDAWVIDQSKSDEEKKQ